MIPTVNESSREGSDRELVLFSHVVFDFNRPECVENIHSTSEAPSLTNLLALKCGTLNSLPNNKMESTEVLRDLNNWFLPAISKSVLLVDISSVRNGRNLQDLHKVSTAASKKVDISYVTSSENKGYQDEITFGCFVDDIRGENGNRHRVFPAACVVSASTAAAVAEFDPNAFQTAFKIPILLDVHSLGSVSGAIDELLRYPNQEKVCIINFTLCTDNCHDVLKILDKTKALVCINTFGKASVYYPSKGPMPFNDEQIVDFLSGLSQDVLKTRIILSVNINAKIMTRDCGGPGYAHMIESVVSRLLAAQVDGQSFPVQELISGTASSFISWFTPPKTEEIRVDEVNCFVCHKQFPAASEERYEKFGYIYCSSACLLSHKRSGFEGTKCRKVDL